MGSTSAIQVTTQYFNLIERRKKRPERGEDKEYIKRPIQSVLFADKPVAETLMNTGCAVFGQDRTSVSRCFQVLPSHFSGDHPFDPILIPSQIIIQPKSTTSQQYGVIIHISLWLYKPERKELNALLLLHFLSPSLPLCLCLFCFDGVVEGYSTERVLHTSIGLKIDLAGFLRHSRRILASHTPPPPPSSHKPTMPDFTAGSTCMLIRHGTILSLPYLHHNLR